MNSAAKVNESPDSIALGIHQTPSSTPGRVQRKGLIRQVIDAVSNVYMLLTKRIFLLLILAFIALLFSLIIEQFSMSTQQEIHGIVSIKTLSELLREVAFAFLIAFAIIATVELESREDREKRAEVNQNKFLSEVRSEVNTKLKQIQENVFYAMFERKIPRAIVDEINLLVFSANFVRLDHHQTLTLRNINATDLDKNLPPCELVKLEIVCDYTVKNMTQIEKPFEIRLSTENPPDEILRKHGKVEILSLSLTLDGKPINAPAVIEETHHTHQHSTVNVWKVDNVPPDAQLKIMTKQVVIKYPNDYEVWRSAYPTCQLKFTVEYPEQVRSFAAETLHRLPLRATPINDRMVDYEVPGPLLPHQGVLVRWYCKPTGLDEMVDERRSADAG
jgi:hypothetical protein